jgi:hypothetical protein
MKKKDTQEKISKLDARLLRHYTENRQIANRAVQKAIEENRKYGIKDSYQFSNR